MKTLRSFLFLVAGLGALGCGPSTSPEELGSQQDSLIVTTFTAVADTYVMGNNSGLHGGEAGIVVTRYDSNNYRREGFVAFDVPPGLGITAATLSLKLRYYTGNGVDTASIRLYGLKDLNTTAGCLENFSESALVYNLVPFANFAEADGITHASVCLTSSTPLVTKTVSTNQVGQAIDFSSQALVDFVNANSITSSLTFVLTTDTLGPFISFESRENTTPPRLTVSRPATCSELQADVADGVLSLNYQGSNLSHCNLSGLNLSGLNLSGLNFNGINLSGANLSGANLKNTTMNGADLRGAVFSGADLSGTDLKNTKITGVDFSGANFSGADLYFVNFSGINLSGAHLSGVKVIPYTFIGSDLRGADLSGLNLSDEVFDGADLRGANFSGVKLVNTRFRGANLSNTTLTGVNFFASILTGADLTGANLSGTEFGISDLSNVTLTGADLSNANFTNANLTGADLVSANLTGAVCTDVILTDARFSSTICPDGVNSDSVGLTCIGHLQ